MADETINADFSKAAVVHTAAMDWQPSPSPTVWRKRLDLTGAKEASRVTSVVRYDADSHFREHPHPDGEEILVLDGVFSDEHGDYPAGTFLLNPEGFAHAPFSQRGCVMFVKLRQYPGLGRRQIKVRMADLAWRPGGSPAVTVATLYQEAGYPESIELVRLAPGGDEAPFGDPTGEEIFVLEGAMTDGQTSYQAGTWGRFPAGHRHRLRSADGCVFYRKSGHLRP